MGADELSETVPVCVPGEFIYVRTPKGELLVYLVTPSGAVTLITYGRES